MKESLWLSGFKAVTTPILSSDVKCDICIVGGGLSGIYSAYLLAKQGVNVVLVEAQPSIAHGATSYSTGKLTAQHAMIYSKLSREQGKVYYQANQAAIERAVITNPPSIQRTTSYLYSATEEGKLQLIDEANAYKKMNIPLVATNEIELGIPLSFALGMKQQLQINPAEFTNHFALLARQAGAELFTNTRVIEINASEQFVRTAAGPIVHYNKLILCTHYPIESVKGLYSVKLQISRSYLTATKTTELLDGQYISIDQDSRTIRTALVNNERYFVYGGRSHLAGTETQTQPFYNTLTSELTQYFELPNPSFTWSAQDTKTADHIPYIGQLTKNDDTIYIATGFNKWGLSSSLVAGEILSSLLTHTYHEAAELYNPSRSAFGRKLYFMLTTGSFISEQLVAGYMQRLNAPRCTHLGCKTRWNEGDETWDCPCHGSRYDKNGDVIEGPAVYPLHLKKEDT